jgi:hypothetical protein
MAFQKPLKPLDLPFRTQADLDKGKQRMEFLESLIPVEPLASRVRESITAQLSRPFGEDLLAPLDAAVGRFLNPQYIEDQVLGEIDVVRGHIAHSWVNYLREAADLAGGASPLGEQLVPPSLPSMWDRIRYDVPSLDAPEWISLVDGFVANVKASLPLWLPDDYVVEEVDGLLRVRAEPRSSRVS